MKNPPGCKCEEPTVTAYMVREDDKTYLCTMFAGTFNKMLIQPMGVARLNQECSTILWDYFRAPKP